jgi:putative membrane protein
MMVDDHTRIADSLRALAGEKDVMLPTDLKPGDLALLNQLTGLSGDTFDKAYMGAMARDHRTEIAVFQTEANSGSDKDLQGFASKELPTLRQHLQMAEITAASVGAGVTSVPDL